MASKSDFISEYRAAVGQFLNALHTYRALRLEFDALNYATELTDADFEGANADIVKADIIASAGSLDATQTLMAANTNQHYGRLFRVKK